MFRDFQRGSEGSYEDALKGMIDQCAYDCIVGNGYAAILPLFAERYGRGLKVVHIRRDDRAAYVVWSRTVSCFPMACRYYSQSTDATVKRMAAFHFGEMSREEWDR